ncbi:hypothetical protein [Labrys wisconsinensis]|uniref:Uncharacterized protein n=1 Tax=Labrys wisconsinensis TaxID=425677 RepID=A0ABU0JMK2_9HYPH|nr:hypothetical protein [Labrys wisconsinensis]MDQ0474855.1 hypothetical protein [Labrys wisconsinensis]
MRITALVLALAAGVLAATAAEARQEEDCGARRFLPSYGYASSTPCRIIIEQVWDQDEGAYVYRARQVCG